MRGTWLEAPCVEAALTDVTGAVAGRSEGTGDTARVSRARAIAASARDAGACFLVAALSLGGFPCAAFFLSAGCTCGSILKSTAP